MAKANKKSFAYKLQKNPFLFVFIIIIAAVILFAIINITDSIAEKNQNKAEETTATDVITTEPVKTLEDKSVKLTQVKKYDSEIVSVTAEKFAEKVMVKAVYSNKSELLEAHFVDNSESLVVPVFCFYTNDGVQLKCPGELEIVEDNAMAIYSLSLIDDYKNAVAVSDEVTVDFDNILNDGFNLYLHHKETGAGKTIFGTYEKTVEEYNNLNFVPVTSDIVTGIKNIEIAENDKFIWIDIYYNDSESYSNLNYNFDTNFICFEFEKNGEKYKRDFIISEYEDLNMIRCKFDEYSLNELNDETGDSGKTVAELYEDYTISVSSRDYKTETVLFKIN